MQHEMLYLRQEVEFLKKSIKEGQGSLILNDNTSYKFQIIHEMVKSKNNVLSVSMLCDIAKVSRSGYYRWINAEEKRKKLEERDRKDFELILIAYQYRGYDKGARGIYMRLLHMNPPIIMNVKKIRCLMKKYNLFCPKHIFHIIIQDVIYRLF